MNSTEARDDPHAGQPLLTVGAALGEGRIVAIMVHGRGARPEDILTLVPALERGRTTPSVTYLAPAAAGRTWYPFSFLTDVEKNEPYLSSALARLAALVRDVEARGIGRERIVLMGFSQGACLASEFAVRHAGRYAGVVAFSGGVIGPPGTRWNYPGAFGGTPVFLGCSDVDAHIPAARVHETADVFARMGADVVTRLYPGMGHLVNDDEILEARKILDGPSSA